MLKSKQSFSKEEFDNLQKIANKETDKKITRCAKQTLIQLNKTAYQSHQTQKPKPKKQEKAPIEISYHSKLQKELPEGYNWNNIGNELNSKKNIKKIQSGSGIEKDKEEYYPFEIRIPNNDGRIIIYVNAKEYSMATKAYAIGVCTHTKINQSVKDSYPDRLKSKNIYLYEYEKEEEYKPEQSPIESEVKSSEKKKEQ